MESFNRLAARKEIGAIRHRLIEENLLLELRHQIIARHMANLLDTLPERFHGLLARMTAANYNDLQELAAGLDLLAGLIPATYGSIPAGTVFIYANRQVVKRKDGIDFDGIIEPHLPADAIITIVNDRSI